jgi:hypothetical protein
MDLKAIVLATASVAVAASCSAGEPACALAAISDTSDVYVSNIDSETPVVVRVEGLDQRVDNPFSLSPDGSKLAYFLPGDPSVLHVSDLSGKKRRYRLSGKDPNSQLTRWESNHIVRVEREWKNMSEFFFYRLSEADGLAQSLGESEVGDDCTLSSDSKHVACMEGSRAYVDHRKVFVVPIASYSSYVGTFLLPLGQSVSSDVAPGTTIELEGYSQGTAHLSYQNEGSVGPSETWLHSGDVLPIDTDSGAYYLIPEFHAGDLQIRMRVRRPDEVHARASSAIAWSNDGAQLTVLFGTYIATLRRMGSSHWQVESQGVLAFDPGARSLRYSGPSLLVVSGAAGHFSLNTRAWVVPSSSIAPLALPKSMNISSENGERSAIAVKDVACR